MVGRARVPAPDRPRAAGAARAQDDQLPVLERLRRGGAPAARGRPGAHALRRGHRRRQPAAPEDETRRGRRHHGGGVPHRGPAPAGRRDPQLHPRLDPRGQVHLPEDRARAAGHAARRAGRRAAALPPRRHPGEGPLDGDADGAARRARPPLPDRPARVREHRQGVPRRRRLPRAVPAHRVPGPQPRPTGRKIGRTLPRRAHRGPLARVPGRDWRDSPAAELAHPLRRSHRLHAPQRPRRRLQPQVRGSRSGATRVPVHRPAVQELLLLARHPARAFGRARRPRRAPDHRAQLEPARGSARLRLLGQVQEPLPGEHRHQARATGRADRRDRRGLRLRLQPRPDRVPPAPRAASTCTRRWGS